MPYSSARQIQKALQVWRTELQETGRADTWPDQHDEFWKYSKASAFAKAGHPKAEEVLPGYDFNQLPDQWKVQLHALRSQVDGLLVFCNGQFQKPQSAESFQNSVQFSALSSLESAPSDLLSQFSVPPEGQNAFLAQNLSELQDGMYLRVAASERVLTFAIVYIYDETKQAQPYRLCQQNFVHVQNRSKVALLEMHLSLSDQQPFTFNQFNSIRVNGDSSLERVRVMGCNSNTLVFDRDDVTILDKSNVRNLIMNVSGKWVRCESRARLESRDASFDSYGFYLTTGSGHTDHSTTIEHVAADTRSEQLFKAVLLDASRGVFNGKVVIHQDAQKSNAKQLNQNLVLGEKAEADTRPQLEVFADDVKAAHGATIGRLNGDEIFYLRSRGVGHDAAVSMVAEGFIRDLVLKIENQVLRENLDAILSDAFQIHVKNSLGVS